MLLVSILVLIAIVVSTVELCLGNRQIRWLSAVPAHPNTSSPKVLVIVAARNEEKKVEAGLRSILRQDYQNLEILIVNDRSTDRTDAILDRLAQANPRLRVIHNTQLPPGWLGKNYALYLGTQQAAADIFLFMDADIVLEPTTIRRAVLHLENNKVDHLTLATHLNMPGILLPVCAGVFTIFFGLFFKAWKASDPRSKRFIGIGAFNMVRSQAYRAIGMHQAIAMRPDDDLMLGKLIKKHGFRQELLLASDLVSVEWYSSFKELCHGLEKNSFAGVNYSLVMAIGGTIAQWLLFVWPLVGVVATSGLARSVNLASYVVLVLLYWDNARFHHLKRWSGILIPVVTLLLSFAFWRSIVLTIKNGGIGWRGTHYTLAELKANKV